MITVCFPVIKRYDLLKGALLSLQQGSVQPSRICVIDNGRQEDRVRGVVHLNSQTLAASTHEEVVDHHRKMLLARANYVRKWPHTAPDFPDVQLEVKA